MISLERRLATSQPRPAILPHHKFINKNNDLKKSCRGVPPTLSTNATPPRKRQSKPHQLSPTGPLVIHRFGAVCPNRRRCAWMNAFGSARVCDEQQQHETMHRLLGVKAVKRRQRPRKRGKGGRVIFDGQRMPPYQKTQTSRCQSSAQQAFA